MKPYLFRAYLRISMKLALLVLIFCIHSSVFAAQVVNLKKEEFKLIYYSMMVDTYAKEEQSQLAGMGGIPVPYLLIYSVKEEKFVNNMEKFTLLELSKLNGGKLEKTPLILENRPEGHHFFERLSFQNLQKFIPKASKNNEYIVIYSGETLQSAVVTEDLFMGARNGIKPKHHVEIPALLAHINTILSEKKWQTFKHINN